MTIEQLRARIEVLQIEKANIASQVDMAKRTAKESGIFSDAKWLTSAEFAMRKRGREIARLQVELGEANKAAKKVQREVNIAEAEARCVPFERQFMWQAKKLLPASLYELVLTQTTLIERGTQKDGMPAEPASRASIFSIFR